MLSAAAHKQQRDIALLSSCEQLVLLGLTKPVSMCCSSLCSSARGMESLPVHCSCTVVEPTAMYGGANWGLKSVQSRTCEILLTKMLISVHKHACKTLDFLIL